VQGASWLQACAQDSMFGLKKSKSALSPFPVLRGKEKNMDREF